MGLSKRLLAFTVSKAEKLLGEAVCADHVYYVMALIVIGALSYGPVFAEGKLNPQPIYVARALH